MRWLQRCISASIALNIFLPEIDIRLKIQGAGVGAAEVQIAWSLELHLASY